MYARDKVWTQDICLPLPFPFALCLWKDILDSQECVCGIIIWQTRSVCPGFWGTCRLFGEKGRATHMKHQQEVRPELLSDVLEKMAIGNLGDQGTFAFRA